MNAYATHTTNKLNMKEIKQVFFCLQHVKNPLLYLMGFSLIPIHLRSSILLTDM